MARFGDWDNPYLTMNFKQEADIVCSLGAIAKAGHIEPGLNLWTGVWTCGLHIGRSQVEYEDKNPMQLMSVFRRGRFSHLLHVWMCKWMMPLDIVIWTTTPWTSLVNEAVALHAEIEYQLVKARADEKAPQNFILAKELVLSATERYGFNSYEVLADFTGDSLKTWSCNTH